MMEFDKNPDVVGWNSEELAIPYRSPVDGRVHRYFPDMLVKKRNGDVILVEVKPYHQTQEPKGPPKRTKAFIYEATTYLVNQAKWKAAEEYCKVRDWKFQIITEKELYGK